LSLFFPLQNKSRRDGNHSNTFHITPWKAVRLLLAHLCLRYTFGWLSFSLFKNKSRRDGNHSNTFHITHGRQAACLNPPFASAIPLVGYLFHSLKINQGEMDIKKYAPYLRGIFFYILYFL
jgi:hypothetical protein